MEGVEGLAPLTAIYEVVPLGNQIAERTALMTERNAAVHAASALLSKLLLRLKIEVLVVVTNTFSWVSRNEPGPVDSQESADFTHPGSPPDRPAELQLPPAPQARVDSRVA